MGYKLTDLEEKDRIILDIYKSYEDNHLEMNAVLYKHIGDDKAIIILGYNGDKVLNFSNVKIDAIYHLESGIPVIWRGVKVLHNKNYYILHTPEDGIKTNRRSSFRVSVGITCSLNSISNRGVQVSLRDISLAGFSITDRKNELTLSDGEKVSIKFNDLFFDIYLEGVLVRVDKHDNYTVYGFKLTNLCKELSAYINLKQRKK